MYVEQDSIHITWTLAWFLLFHIVEEAYYNYYRYYKRRVSPQVDVRIVIAITITVVSVLQVSYFVRKTFCKFQIDLTMVNVIMAFWSNYAR